MQGMVGRVHVRMHTSAKSMSSMRVRKESTDGSPPWAEHTH